MAKHTEQYARETGPVGGADSTGRTGVMRVALSGANQSFTLPTTGAEPGKKSTLGGRFITMMVVGTNAQIAFGVGTNININIDEPAALGTGDANAGATLIDGRERRFLVPSEATHLSFRGTSGGALGFIEYYVSDQPVP